jgi:hypothetical protein
MTPRDTMRLLRQLEACPKARKWAKGRTLRRCWDDCPRGDWLEWLAGALGVAPTAPAWAESERVMATAWAECRRVTAPAWAEYRRVRATAWAEYERVTAPELAEYERVRATAYREAVPYEQIEAAAREVLK